MADKLTFELQIGKGLMTESTRSLKAKAARLISFIGGSNEGKTNFIQN